MEAAGNASSRPSRLAEDELQPVGERARQRAIRTRPTLSTETSTYRQTAAPSIS
jgi:hypothetical protein